MSEHQAVTKIRVEGDDDLVRAGDRIDLRWSTLGKNLGQNVGGAIKAIGQGMMGLVQDSVRVATAMNTINLGQLVTETRTLEMQYTRFGVGAKKNIESAKHEAEILGKLMLMDPGSVIQQERAYGKLTNQIKLAGNDLEALQEVATSQNRDLGDELPLGVMLRKTIGTSGSMRAELGKLADQANTLGYAGGPAAFGEMLGSMAEQLSHVSMETDEARNKVTAFFGALTKGMSADQQKRVGGSILGQLNARSEQISRTVGYDILDPKTGKVKDPAKVMQDLRARALRLYGTRGALKVLRREFQNEEGTALYNFDAVAAANAENPNQFSAAGEAAPNAQDALRNSKAGQREGKQLDRAAKLRDGLGGPLADIQDWWGGLFENSPLVGQAANFGLGGLAGGISSFVGSKLAFGGAAKGAAAAAGAAKGVGTTAGSLGLGGLLLPVLGGLVGGGANAAVYGAVRDLDKDKINHDQRKTMGIELAGKVADQARRGEIGRVDEAAPQALEAARTLQGGGQEVVNDVLREMLAALTDKKDLPDQFQTTVKQAFKDALRESGATVSQGSTPNPSRKETGKRAGSGEADT